jgi:type I restriction enzyme S subunit
MTKYKQAEIGLIPQDWQDCAIGDLNPFITSGSRGWAEFYSDRGTPFIRVTNLSRSSIYLDLTDLQLVDLPAGENEGIRSQLQNGDLLFSVTGNYIGKISYVDDSVSKPAYVNQHVAVVRFNSDKVDSHFVAYFMAGVNAQRHIRSVTDLGAKLGMSLATIHRIRIALPPLPEQRAIAAALSDMDALINSLDSLIAKKRDMKHAAMQQLLSGKIRLPGFKDAWVCEKLGKLSELITKGTTPTSIGRGFVQQGINFIKVESITDDGGFLTDKLAFVDQQTNTLLARSQLKEFDILISIAGALGRTAMVHSDLLPANTNQALAIVRLHPDCRLNHEYLLFALGTRKMKQNLLLMSVQGAQANLSLQNIRDLAVTFPEMDEQLAIVEILADMQSEITVHRCRREKALLLKQAMMQKLLTGQIRLV